MKKKMYLAPEAEELILSAESGILFTSGLGSGTNLSVDDETDADWNY